MKFSRRTVLGMGAAMVALSSSPLLAGPRLNSARPLAPKRKGDVSGIGQVVEANLHAKVRPTDLFGQGKMDLWTFHNDILPVIKVPQGGRLRTYIKNDLPEHTSIHWHGIRLPNEMDGVPYVTQKPIEPGEDFIYDFELPDTDCFHFTHIATL